MKSAHGITDPKILHTELNTEIYRTVYMDMEYIFQLLEQGADPCRLDDKASGQHQMSALHRAAVMGNDRLLTLLLEYAPNPNVLSSSSLTPLMFAIYYAADKRCYESVQALLDAGAKPISNGQKNLYYMTEAAKHIDVRILPALAKAGGDINEPDDRGNTPIHIAAQYTNPKLVRYLIDQKADLFALSHQDHNVLHFAAMGKSAESFHLLMAACGDKAPEMLNAKNSHDWSVLHTACNAQDMDVLQAVLSHKPDLLATNLLGQSPLRFCAQQGFNDSLDCLLQHHSAELSAAGELEKALSIAVKNNHIDCVETLIKYGANYMSPDANGNTITCDALALFIRETVALLMEKGSPIPAMLFDADTNYQSRAIACRDYVQHLFSTPINPDDVTLNTVFRVSNMGLLNELFRPAIWRGHEEKLYELLRDAPAGLQTHILQSQPAISQILTPPEPVIDGWSSNYAGPLSMVAGGHRL